MWIINFADIGDERLLCQPAPASWLWPV